MPKLTLIILKEDILLDNYMDYNECPITKAIRRVVKNGEDIGTELRFGYNNDYVILDDTNTSYVSLIDKLYGMYNSFSKNKEYNYQNEDEEEIIPSPIPVETFTHELIW